MKRHKIWRRERITTFEFATAYHICIQRVRRWHLKKFGKLPPKRVEYWNAKLCHECLAALAHVGMTTREVSKSLGIPVGNLQYWIRTGKIDVPSLTNYPGSSVGRRRVWRAKHISSLKTYLATREKNTIKETPVTEMQAKEPVEIV